MVSRQGLSRIHEAFQPSLQMNYRKLENSEIEAMLGFKIQDVSKRYVSVITHVARYYPKGAVRAVVQFASEYNDENYKAHIAYLAVFDTNGNEILPIPSTARKCRAEWNELSIPNVTNRELSEPPDDNDLVIPLVGTGLPELFVKED